MPSIKDAVIGSVLVGRPLRELVELFADTATVYDVLVKFNTCDFLCVPLYTVGLDGQKQYLGIVHVLNLLHYIIDLPAFSHDEYASWQEVTGKLLAGRPTMLSRPAVDLLALSEESKAFRMYGEDEPLRVLMDAFSSGVHRVLVRLSGRGLVSIVTQTDIIRFAVGEFASAGAGIGTVLSSVTAQDIVKPTPVCMRATESTLAGLKLLVSGQIGAVGVVDDVGVLVANLSASRFRGMGKRVVNYVGRPVIDFLTALSSPLDVPRPICCVLTDPFLRVMDLMIRNHVHRLWVVDNHGKPSAIVTMTDVIRTLGAAAAETDGS